MDVEVQMLATEMEQAIHLQELEEDCYGGLSDRSIEFTMMEQMVQDEREEMFFRIESDIIEYLKQRGLRMKTDPRAKQERYYQRQKKKGYKKAMTMIEEEDKPTISQSMTPQPCHSKGGVCIQMNSILIRRMPSQKMGSTPLIQTNIEIGNNKKSRFFQKEPTSIYSDSTKRMN